MTKYSICKSISYELSYLRQKINLPGKIKFLIYIVCAIIVGFSDAQAFFIGPDSIVPGNWSFLKNKSHVSALSVLILIVLTLIEYNKKSKGQKELFSVISNYIIPSVDTQLEALCAKISSKFKIVKLLRISIFVPVRIGFLRWRLQMVCRTSNIPEKEMKALFTLDEGVIGYTLLKTENHNIEFVDLTNTKAPKIYKDLCSDNSNLISRSIKAILIAAAFQDKSVAGLLAVDTDNPSNLEKMKQHAMHDAALDWIVAKNGVVHLLWRLKNNV